MTKRILGSLFFSFFTVAVFSQTIVNTTPENKKVILEEFTGINCVYCPDGHAIANAIKDNNPDNFFVINIHQGGFANPGANQPDFRTPFGDAIVAQSYSGAGFGYPSGTINRQNFPGREMTAAGTTAMGRNFWTVSANEAMAQPSYVNVGVEAEIDIETSEITVNVEAYYTADSPVSTNKLNVALLQNNTLGPQTGGGMGNNYPHMHRLVHMITGQWGVDINNTTEGTLIEESFTYTIPTHYNGVPVDLNEMEVVVFVAEGNQNIISGNGTEAVVIPSALTNDVRIENILEFDPQCGAPLSPFVAIQNLGNNEVTSLEISYSVNSGAVETYNWSGNLSSGQVDLVALPGISYELEPLNTLEITLPNDQNNSNNTITATFEESDLNGTGSLVLSIQTDNWGNEVRWNIRDSNNAIVYQGGPYGNNQTYTIPISLDEDCYQFNLIDLYGDGGGPVSLTDSDGTVIYSTNGSYGLGETVNFNSDGVLGVEDNTFNMFALYPNPSTGIVNIQTKNNLDIIVYEITGKMVFTESNISNGDQLNLSNLNAGLYIVKMFDGISESIQKLIIK